MVKGNAFICISFFRQKKKPLMGKRNSFFFGKLPTLNFANDSAGSVPNQERHVAFLNGIHLITVGHNLGHRHRLQKRNHRSMLLLELVYYQLCQFSFHDKPPCALARSVVVFYLLMKRSKNCSSLIIIQYLHNFVKYHVVLIV